MRYDAEVAAANSHFFMGRHDEAGEAAQRCVHINPEFIPRFVMLVASRASGRHDQVAQAAVERLLALKPDFRYIDPSGSPFLIAGAHRMEAAKRLGRTWVPALVFDYNKKLSKPANLIQFAKMEIDENLVRNDLKPAERCDLTARRAELVKEMDKVTSCHVGTKSGQGIAGTTAAGSAQQIADMTGRTKSAVARDMKRGKKLGSETLQAVKGTSLDKGTELDALIVLPEKERVDVVKRASSGEDVSAREIARQEGLRANKRRPVTQNLRPGWKIATDEERVEFLIWAFGDLSYESRTRVLDGIADDSRSGCPTTVRGETPTLEGV